MDTFSFVLRTLNKNLGRNRDTKMTRHCPTLRRPRLEGEVILIFLKNGWSLLSGCSSIVALLHRRIES